MNKQEYESKRDEFALVECRKIVPVLIGDPVSLGAARVCAKIGLMAGYDSGYQLAQAEIEELKARYGNHKRDMEVRSEKIDMQYKQIEELKRDAEKLVDSCALAVKSWGDYSPQYGNARKALNDMRQALAEWNSKHGGAK